MLVSVCVHIRVRVCVIVRVVRTVFVCGCRCRRCCCLSAVAGRCCVVVEVCLLLLFAVTLSSVCLSAQILGAHEATPRRNIGARGLPVHHPRLLCFAVRAVVRIALCSRQKRKRKKRRLRRPQTHVTMSVRCVTGVTQSEEKKSKVDTMVQRRNAAAPKPKSSRSAPQNCRKRAPSNVKKPM